MSSHYIIRDDQAPALIVFDTQTVSEKILFAFLEWNPSVIIDESCISFFLHHQIKVDAVIAGIMSENEIDMIMGYQKPYEILERVNFPANLIGWLSKKGIQSVDLIGEFGQSTLKISDRLESDFQVYIYSDHTKYVHIRNGVFKKWASPGRGFQVYRYLPGCKVSTENLETLREDSFKVRNEGPITIESNTPFWVGEIL